MRIARVSGPAGVFLARWEGDLVVPVLAEDPRPGVDPLRVALASGRPLSELPAVAEESPASQWRVLAPVRAPQKVLAIGLNYRDHVAESGLELPKAPVLFVKTPNSICGPDDDIVFSKDDSTQVDYEVELAAVIGRRARKVRTAEALDYVLGYTVCNDVSARDAQFADGQWSRAKSFDTFCPLGPVVVTSDEVGDPQALGLRTRVNGTLLQDGRTADMVFGVAEIVSYLSRVMTLEPGDVIATGTPYGVGFARTPPIFLGHDDEVEVEVDRLGTLRNRVVVV